MIGWNFPSNGGGQIRGIAEAGIETFTGKKISSLAREICQNSLDAAADENFPVTVEFHRHNIATANVLARDDFKDILRRCRTFWTNSHKTQAFFTAAIGRINLSTTSVLRISDIPAKISVDTAKVVPRAEIGDGRTVKLNTSITVVSLDGSKRRPYKISSRFKVLFPDIFDELLGKSIGSTVTLRDGKFTITDIT